MPADERRPAEHAGEESRERFHRPPPPQEPAPRHAIDAAVQEALDAIEKTKAALSDLEYVLELLEDVQTQQSADARQIEQLRQQLRSLTTSRDFESDRDRDRDRSRDRGRGGRRGGDRRQDRREPEPREPRASTDAGESAESGEMASESSANPPADSGRDLTG